MLSGVGGGERVVSWGTAASKRARRSAELAKTECDEGGEVRDVGLGEGWSLRDGLLTIVIARLDAVQTAVKGARRRLDQA